MLEVIEIEFTGAEVKRMKRNVPNEVDVNVNIDKVTKGDAERVMLDFTYAVDYKPQVAKVRVSGVAYCRDTPANIKRLLSEHKKNKAIPFDLGTSVINMINANAGINSIFLIRPFNLLPPFMPPLIAEEGAPTSVKPAKKK